MPAMSSFDFEAHLQQQREWSEGTFGPGPRTAGIIDHIKKELAEVAAAPADISEWVDVVILALDGAWRAGASPMDIIKALVAKQEKNMSRVWPDWRTMSPDKAIEHDRSEDRRSCNRHVDCDAADERQRSRATLAVHCHDENCEDCLGA